MTDDQQVFGIDLGTTYSAIAYINDFGQPEVIPNRDGELSTPSVVFFENATNFVVGKEAKNGMLINADTTVALIKRQVGTDFRLDFHGTEFRPESISALILKDLVDYAQQETGIATNKVAITVPAYFGLAEKEATRQAGEIAGLDVVGVLTEPVSAALSIGIAGEEKRTVFVYDLGGGTFDCTIMTLSPSSIEVLAIDGNRMLGGADWDQRLVDLVNEKFIAQAGLGDEDPTSDEDYAQRLMTEVEGLKKSLSRREKAGVTLRYGDATEKVEVTRAEFETVTRTLVDQTLNIVRRTLATAEQKRPGVQLDEVLLVGGSAKMPMVQASLENDMGWTLRMTDLDLAVAKGAAIYGQGASVPELTVGAASSNGQPADPGNQRLLPAGNIQIGDNVVEIRNVLSRSLGVRWVRENADFPGGWEPYIGFEAHQQDQLPLHVRFEGVAAQDNTTALTIRIYEQISAVEDESLEANNEITPESGATLSNLPNLPASSVIEFELSVDHQGQGVLSAFEPVSNQRVDLPAYLAVMQAEDVAKAKQTVDGMVRAY